MLLFIIPVYPTLKSGLLQVEGHLDAVMAEGEERERDKQVLQEEVAMLSSRLRESQEVGGAWEEKGAGRREMM